MRLPLFAGALAAALSVSVVAGGATTQENLAKYTRLRQRLRTDFMVVGTGPGRSIPAEVRHDGQGWIKWADATINHGWYIGILATEYHLRANPAWYPGADGGDASAAGKTLDELHDALAAMERLDEVADAAFPSPCTTTPALNGFFLRDDVPGDMHLSFAGLTSTQSDFVDPTLTNKEMSQDQVYHVLMGLALVKQLVPQSVVVKGKTLRAWAMEQAKRIGQHFAKGDWVIRNPACGNRAVNRGDQGIGYSGGTRLAFEFLTDGALVPTTGINLWGTLRSPSNPAYNDADNLHMAMAIAAVGNGWGATTAADLSTLSAKQDWPLYPIVHRVLHGANASGFCQATGAALNTRARTMIDELPNNGNPVNPLPGPPAPHGFTSNNRFIRSKDQAYAGQVGGEGMSYSGTDFMLLHNVYAIATPSTWTQGPSAAPCSAPPLPSDAGADGSSVVPPSSTGEPGGVSSGGPGGDTPAGDAGSGDTSSGCACGIAKTDAPAALMPIGLIAAAIWIARRRRRT
jgi:hypothetical protein